MANSPEAKINSLRGIPWMGFPPDITTGNIWFVDSGHPFASDNTHCGESPLEPFATIDYAIGKCTASNGDIIYVMPGHAETVNATATLTCDVAGISIVGLGNGTNRPSLPRLPALLLPSLLLLQCENQEFAGDGWRGCLPESFHHFRKRLYH